MGLPLQTFASETDDDALLGRDNRLRSQRKAAYLQPWPLPGSRHSGQPIRFRQPESNLNPV